MSSRSTQARLEEVWSSHQIPIWSVFRADGLDLFCITLADALCFIIALADSLRFIEWTMMGHVSNREYIPWTNRLLLPSRVLYAQPESQQAATIRQSQKRFRAGAERFSARTWAGLLDLQVQSFDGISASAYGFLSLIAARTFSEGTI